MASWVRVGSFLMVALMASGCAEELRPPRSGWIEVETPHFVLETSLARVHALETAAYLERTRAAMLQAAWDSKGPPRRAQVVVFSRSSEFARFSLVYTAGETLQLPGFERCIVFSRQYTTSIPTIAAHELAHWLSGWYMPLQPPWLAEGLATFLETVRVQPEQNLAFVGAPAPSRDGYLETNAPIDSGSLFAARSARAGGAAGFEPFYATSWLLVRYLIDEHQRPFSAFQRNVAMMTDWREAFRASMPPELADTTSLNQQLSKYWSRRDNWLFASQVPIHVEPFEPKVRPLPDAAVQGLHSWLLIGFNREQAEQAADEALRLNPFELSALRTKFYLAPTVAVRVELAQRAVTAHPF